LVKQFIPLFFLTSSFLQIGVCQQAMVGLAAGEMSVKKSLVSANTYAKAATLAPPAAQPVLTEKSSPKIASPGINIAFLPLFGGFEKTEAQQVEDQMFINDCDRSFSTRAEAADFFIKMGWQYLEEGNRENAIHRFNLSYLIAPANSDIFWGLGVVEYQNGRPEEAVRLFKEGLKKSESPNPIMMVDLATIYIQMASQNPRAVEETHQAEQLLEAALVLQPNYTTAYMQLSLLYIFQNKLELAWANFHHGYEQSPSEANAEILNELLKRMPDPKGIFTPKP
jgi:tetratricopeptide (TPR) repeat protein